MEGLMSHADAVDYCREYGLLDEEAMSFDHPLVRALTNGDNIVMTMSFNEPLEDSPDDGGQAFDDLVDRDLQEIEQEEDPYPDVTDPVERGRLEEADDEARRQAAGLPSRRELLQKYGPEPEPAGDGGALGAGPARYPFSP
jgi:hypothetical protein